MTDELGGHTVQWFGSNWGSPLNESCPHAPTPVGVPCGRCTEPIVERDRGVNMWHVGLEGGGYRPYHMECNVRTVVGPIDHVLHHGLGGCSGECLPDPEWLTPREAAEFVARLVAFYQTRVPRGTDGI
jgi:hypothetical protein